MYFPEHARPGTLVNRLALDAARALYETIGLTGDAAATHQLHPVFAAAVEGDSRYRSHEERWRRFCDAAARMLPEEAARRCTTWMSRAYIGYHPANPDFSAWMKALNYFAGTGWPQEALAAAELRAFQALGFHVRAAMHEGAAVFAAAADAARAGPLTDRDRDLHMRFDFNYHDDTQGRDPFLVLSFVHRGKTFREAVAGFDFDAHAPFPFETLRRITLDWRAREGGWMPPGHDLEGLREALI